MVQEFRRIGLSKQELILALAAHNRMVPGFLPTGKIIDFDILNETSIMVTVETEPLFQEASVIFPDSKLIHALIRYCLENNIMLPREGRKSVKVGEDTVSLCIDLEIETYAVGDITDRLKAASYATA